MMNVGEDKAWLVFTNQTDLKVLRFLKPGFRHCFVVMKRGEQWLSIDPMAHYTEVALQDEGIVTYLAELGYDVIEVPKNSPNKSPAPPMILTCVEACKRLLGIHNFIILTPWQLYRHVQKMKNRKEPYHGKLNVIPEHSPAANCCREGSVTKHG